MRQWLFITFSPIIVATLFISCHTTGKKIYRKSEFLMDTIVTISIVSESKRRANDVIEKVFSEIKRIEHLLNYFSSESEISEINRNAGIRLVKVSPDTQRLIERSLEVAEKTRGAFDITVGVITNLYDFHKGIRPSDDLIHKRLPLVDYRNIVIDYAESAIFLKEKGMSIDPGGIAKGYTADRVVELLKSEGIKAALVAVAGDIRGYGLKPDGKPWKVGIRDPRGKSDDIIAAVELKDIAISTSGDYERFFTENGIRYHHLIDPKTGYPAQGVISVTVMAPLTVYTDSFATALFISGVERGMTLAHNLGYNALMVDEKGQIHMTEPLRGKIEFTQKGS